MPADNPSDGDAPTSWNATTVALSIFLGGMLVLAACLIWAISSPTGSPAASVMPATVTDALDGMPGMTGTTTTAAAAATTAAAAAAVVTAAPHKTHDASLPALGAGNVHHYTIRLVDEVLEIAPGVHYRGWTFDGGAPGPVIHVRQGDWVDVTLVNGGAIPHSIDFHAALIAPDRAFRSIPSGGRLHFRFRAETPGVFMYHCGTPPVLAHIANGMYGAIVVDPKAGLPPVAKSYVLVSGEWYLDGDGKAAPATLDFEAARAMRPTYVTFNGYANQTPGRASTPTSTSSVRSSTTSTSTAPRPTSCTACRRSSFRPAAAWCST
jgi:nitrite reductase (NO-forming)